MSTKFFVTVQQHGEQSIDDEINDYVNNLDTVYTARVKELGTNAETPHWHFYLILKKRTRDTTLYRQIRKILSVNTIKIEVAKGNHDQNRAYIFKQDETRMDGFQPSETGELPEKGRSRTEVSTPLNMVETLQKADGLMEIAREDPAYFIKHSTGLKAMAELVEAQPERLSMDVQVYYGDAGTGKSAWATALGNQGEGGQYHFTKVGGSNGVAWFDGYKGETTLIIDDFTGRTMTHEAMLKVLGTDPFRCEFKGGSRWAAWTRVIITSNMSPWSWYRKYWSTPGNEYTEKAFFRRVNKIVHCTKGVLTETGININMDVYKDSAPFQAMMDFTPVAIKRVHMGTCDQKRTEAIQELERRQAGDTNNTGWASHF